MYHHITISSYPSFCHWEDPWDLERPSPTEVVRCSGIPELGAYLPQRCLRLEIPPLGKFNVILIILHLQMLALQICGSYAPSASNGPSAEFVVICLQTFQALHVLQCSFFAEVKHPICPHWQWPCGDATSFAVFCCASWNMPSFAAKGND